MANRGVTESTVWEVWFDQPVIVPNYPGRSGTYLMIGLDSQEVLWTIPLVEVDPGMALWRPITAFPPSARMRGKHGKERVDA